MRREQVELIGNKIQTHMNNEPRDVARIRELNDALRRTPCGPHVFVTSGVDALPSATVAEIVRRVARHDDFAAENDPHSEHDFGSFEVEGNAVFWKIDYFDLALEAHSPNPADETVTWRVLTIGLMEEY